MTINNPNVATKVVKQLPGKRPYRYNLIILGNDGHHLTKPKRLKCQEQTTNQKNVSSLSCVRLSVTPWTEADQAPLFMGFSRQEYWSGLPFPSPGDLPHPGIEPGSPALQAVALPSKPPGIKLVSPPNLKSLGSKPKDLINHRLGVFRKFQKQTRICHKLATIYT